MTKKTTSRTAKRKKVLPVSARTLTTKSRLFNDLTTTKTFDVRTSKTTKAGVRVSTTGSKKLTTVEILIPSTTVYGEDRVVKVTLTGRQAKAVFDTMERHYNTF